MNEESKKIMQEVKERLFIIAKQWEAIMRRLEKNPNATERDYLIRELKSLTDEFKVLASFSARLQTCM